MIDIFYKKKFLKINQIWYPDVTIEGLKKQKRAADVLFVHGVGENEIHGKNRYFQEFHSCISSLEGPEEEILSAFDKTVRYEIRRSEKDGIDICFYTGEDIKAYPGLLHTFSQIYRKMYHSKGKEIPLNLATVERYLNNQALVFSAVKKDGEILLFHSNVFDESHARLLHSASLFRDNGADANLIGRANKRLHWEDMKYLKEKGITSYDWGGISDFEHPNGIDAFKLKFGGEKTTYYNVFTGNTLLGNVSLNLLKKAGKLE